jgi:small-conductance mechanosensitive channel
MSKRTIVGLIVLALLLVLIPLDMFRGHILQLEKFSRGEFFRILAAPYFYLGEQPVNLTFLLEIILFMVVLAIFTRLARRILRDDLLPRTSLDSGQRFAVERMAGYFIYLMATLIALQTTGVNLTSLAFLGGALGLVLGFGLQNISSNFLSGLILLVERPIKVGDRIEVGELNGDVTRIGTRSTWIRTNDNVVIIVPNADFITNRVINWTANDRKVRFSMAVGVSYGSDPAQVQTILISLAKEHPDVLENPVPECLFKGFGDSSLDFELRFWTQTQVQTPTRLKSDLYYSIFTRFTEERIEIPFPQRDLHLRSVDPEVSLRLNGRADAADPRT